MVFAKASGQNKSMSAVLVTAFTVCGAIWHNANMFAPELKPPNSVAKVLICIFFFILTHCLYPREPIRKQRLADKE